MPDRSAVRQEATLACFTRGVFGRPLNRTALDDGFTSIRFWGAIFRRRAVRNRSDTILHVSDNQVERSGPVEGVKAPDNDVRWAGSQWL